MGSRGPGRPLAVMLVVAAMLVLPVMLAAAPKPPTPVPSPSPSPSPTPTPVPLHIKSMRFDPAALTIAVGQTVQFVNEDKIQHTVTDANGVWDSGTIEPGKSWQQTFVKAGTYEFLCGFHPVMRGRIVVTALSSATFSPNPASVSTLSPAPSPNQLRNPPSD